MSAPSRLGGKAVSYGKPKSFVKAYYEIRFNLDNTRYIPKFDEYTRQEKMRLIDLMLFCDPREIGTWTDERINKQFSRLVKKEISELEKDMTPTS